MYLVDKYIFCKIIYIYLNCHWITFSQGKITHELSKEANRNNLLYFRIPLVLCILIYICTYIYDFPPQNLQRSSDILRPAILLPDTETTQGPVAMAIDPLGRRKVQWQKYKSTKLAESLDTGMGMYRSKGELILKVVKMTLRIF